ANKGSGIGLIALLIEHLYDLSAGSFRQSCELRHGCLYFSDGAFDPHADQDNALKAQLSVLNLIDVFSICVSNLRAVGNPTECISFGEFELAESEIFVIVALTCRRMSCQGLRSMV